MDDPWRDTGNPLRRTMRACWWVTAIATLASLLLLPLEDLLGEVRFVLVVLGGIAALSALLTGWLVGRRAGEFDRLLQGEGVLARWTYSPDEWRRYAIAENQRYGREKRWLYGTVSGIGALVAVALLVLGVDEAEVWATIVAGLAVFIAVIGEADVQRTRRRNLTHQGAALVGRRCAILNGVPYDWSAPRVLLEGCALLDGEPPCVAVTYSVSTRSGRQERVLRIPVPAGHDEEAVRAVSAIGEEDRAP